MYVLMCLSVCLSVCACALRVCLSVFSVCLSLSHEHMHTYSHTGPINRHEVLLKVPPKQQTFQNTEQIIHNLEEGDRSEVPTRHQHEGRVN